MADFVIVLSSAVYTWESKFRFRSFDGKPTITIRSKSTEHIFYILVNKLVINSFSLLVRTPATKQRSWSPLEMGQIVLFEALASPGPLALAARCSRRPALESYPPALPEL